MKQRLPTDNTGWGTVLPGQMPGQKGWGTALPGQMPGQKGAGKGGSRFPARRSGLHAVSGRLMPAFSAMSSFTCFEFGPPNKVREIF